MNTGETESTAREAAGGRADFQPHAADGSAAERPLPTAVDYLAELREYATFYLAARRNALLAALRKWAVVMAVGAVLAVAAMTLVIFATVMLLSGIMAAVNLATGAVWAELIVGAGTLIVVVGALAAGYALLTQAARQRAMDAFEQRKLKQRVAFGHDVDERAAQQRSARLRAAAARRARQATGD